MQYTEIQKKLKPVTWRNHNHMDINTGHKTFDRQCTCISTGNQIGNCVISFYIRSYSNTECNNHFFEPGHLRNTDIGHFKNLPIFAKDYLDIHKEEEFILYHFFHYQKHTKISDGYVITNKDKKLVDHFITNHTQKGYNIINVCKKYVSWE
jgi:hypothetical protein